MPTSFSDLLQNIKQQNQANRDQMWGQISPYLDVFTKQAYYESEKAKLATGLTDLARSEGWEYKAPMVNGKYASPEMIQAHYGSQQKLQLERQASEQWYKSNNLPLPENWNTLTPPEREIVKKKAESDYAQKQAIAATLEAYQDVIPRLPKDFSSKPYSVQMAILNRRVPELKDELEYQMKLKHAGSGKAAGGGSSSGGGGGAGDGMLASTFSQSSGALKAQKESQLALDTLSKSGIMFDVGNGKEKKMVRVAVREKFGGKLGYYFADGSKLVPTFNKKNEFIRMQYYDPVGNKSPNVPVDKTAAVNLALDYYNQVKNAVQVSADEVVRTETGLPKSGNEADPLAKFAIGTFQSGR